MVPGAGLEPARSKRARDFKSLVSTNFTTRATHFVYKKIMERETRFELATPTLARLCSTTELFPHFPTQNNVLFVCWSGSISFFKMNVKGFLYKFINFLKFNKSSIFLSYNHSIKFRVYVGPYM